MLFYKIYVILILSMFVLSIHNITHLNKLMSKKNSYLNRQSFQLKIQEKNFSNKSISAFNKKTRKEYIRVEEKGMDIRIPFSRWLS